MRKLKVGVWLNENVENTSGGAHGYYYILLNYILEYKFSDAEIVLISNKYIETNLNYYLINWEPKNFRSVRNFFKSIFKKIKFKKLYDQINCIDLNHEKNLYREINNKVDLIYYLTPDCKYVDFPFIYTLWDLGHHISYPFPETSFRNIYENRIKYQDYYAQKALAIFSESEAGKQDIIRYLNIVNKKIKVVPLFPSSVVESSVISKIPLNFTELNSPFIHYPAQFWAHKNHYNLLVAFNNLLIEFPNLKLIFTGSDKGNKNYIMSILKELKLENNVIDLGFVTTEELKFLYLNSSGLAMPTLLGPTNMPLLEAAELNCPVACSNFPGHVEQLGEYGYYFNPESPEDITIVLSQMLNENKDHKVKKYISKFNIAETIKQIDKSFSEIKQIRFTWGENY